MVGVAEPDLLLVVEFFVLSSSDKTGRGIVSCDLLSWRTFVIAFGAYIYTHTHTNACMHTHTNMTSQYINTGKACTSMKMDILIIKKYN